MVALIMAQSLVCDDGNGGDIWLGDFLGTIHGDLKEN